MVENARRLMARYRLVRKIAAGGMGTVHAAIDDRLDRPVAVKILDPMLADDPAFLDGSSAKRAPQPRFPIPTSPASSTTARTGPTISW